ncbi:MAG: hypothetical protein HKN76_12535 [Saprospiraceae bacterium]|nr:hypothetical protein [Saprospiraceae bacterium]
MTWICVSSCSLHAQVQDLNVDLYYESQTLGSILEDLTLAYGLEFSYGRIPLEKSTSFRYQGSLDEAMATFFTDNELLHKIIGQHIVLRQDTPFGQPIRGKVTDVNSKMPLLGAHITVIGDTQIGAITDGGGFF